MVAATDLAMAYASQEQFAEAEPLAREAVLTDSKLQPDDWQRFRAESVLGTSLAREKGSAEAEPPLVEGYQGMLARTSSMAIPDLYNLKLARNRLVQLYKDTGKPERVAQELSLPPETDPDIRACSDSYLPADPLAPSG